jgi:PST family polysaccharide transporter
MKQILRATVVLGSSSVVSILIGVVSAKAWAIMVGPSELGFLGLLQGLVGLAGLVAGMGVGAGLVRAGANAMARCEHRQLAALRKAAWVLFWLTGSLAVLTLAVFRAPISRLILGGPEYANSVLLMGLALMFSLATGVQTSILNAYQRVSALAAAGIFKSLLASAASLICVWLWGEQGIAPAIIATAVTGWAVSRYFLRREVGRASVRLSYEEVFTAARSLLRFGLPYTASTMVWTVIQLVVPALVLHTLGRESVGFYQVVMVIAINYPSFLIAAMAQDYYPRLSAVADNPAVLVHLVNQQNRLVLLLTAPLILGLLALAPYIIPLAYSHQFYPATALLEWHLVGDLFKFTSWTMGYVILARSDSWTYLRAELVSGAAYLTAAWVGIRCFGLSGLGIGFVVSCVIYYLIVQAHMRREINLVWTARNRQMMLGTLLTALLVQALPRVGQEGLRTPVAFSCALLAVLGSLYALRREVRGAEHTGHSEGSITPNR